jgi:hypothetical protein
VQAGFDAKKLATLVCQLMQFQEDTLGREVRPGVRREAVDRPSGVRGVGGHAVHITKSLERPDDASDEDVYCAGTIETRLETLASSGSAA